MESTAASDHKNLQEDRPWWDIIDILKLPTVERLVEVLGKAELQYAFNEYVEHHPSLDPIEPKLLIARIFTILSRPNLKIYSLFKSPIDSPTEEPWAEALFCWRVKQHLESNECTAVDWNPINYFGLTKGERQNARWINLKRYRLILVILERLQEDRKRKVLGYKADKIEVIMTWLAGISD